MRTTKKEDDVIMEERKAVLLLAMEHAAMWGADNIPWHIRMKRIEAFQEELKTLRTVYQAYTALKQIRETIK